MANDTKVVIYSDVVAAIIALDCRQPLGTLANVVVPTIKH